MQILNQQPHRPTTYDVRLTALEVDVLFSILGRVGGGALRGRLGQTEAKQAVCAMHGALRDHAGALRRADAIPSTVGGSIVIPSETE